MNYSTLAQALPQDTDGVIIDLQSLYQRFQTVPDARKARGKRYALALVLVALSLAKLAGQDAPAAIADWVKLRAAFFVKVFGLLRASMPHAVTYQRVGGQAATVAGVEQVMGDFLLSAPGAGASQQVTLDGKKLRGVVSVDAERGTYLFAVYLPVEGVVLYEAQIDSKSNEIPLAPQAVKCLNLKGKIITADALHTQRELSLAVVKAGADYVWTVKDNQPTLHDTLAACFQPETTLPGTSPVMVPRTAQTVEKNRGRLETRRLTALSFAPGELDWPHAAQGFKLEREVLDLATHQRSTHTGYGLTSLSAEAASPHRLLQLVRAHWGMESQLHWRRDVLFHEDRTHTQSPTFGQLLACLNNFVIGLATRLGYTNVAHARRYFDAHLDAACLAVISPLS